MMTFLRPALVLEDMSFTSYIYTNDFVPFFFNFQLFTFFFAVSLSAIFFSLFGIEMHWLVSFFHPSPFWLHTNQPQLSPCAWNLFHK